jgi:sterol 14alpha-demethylase
MNALPTPPMLSKRWPLLGHALEFAKDRTALIQRGQASLGNVFAFKLATKTAIVLSGPEWNTLFFKETDKTLDMAKPYGFLKPITGNVSFVADHESYLNQKPLLYAPFQREKMLRYLEITEQTVRQWLDALPDEGRMELTKTITHLVQQVAGYSFLGADFMEKAGDAFWADYEIMGKALDPLLNPNLPLPKFIRRDRARKRMAKTLTPILAERRAYPTRYDDLLQDLINTCKEDGQPATDEELLNFVIALMFAGHETTAGQAAWTIIQLLEHPDYLAQVQQELKDHFPHGSHVDARTLTVLKHIRWAIDETTRMRPSADIVVRVTKEDIEIGGYAIAKDTPIFLNACTSHFMEDIFPNAAEYDPERFSPDRNEHKAHKNAIMGFGGGVHKCPGMSFAQNEMLAITALLLQNFDLKLETHNTRARLDLGASRPTETWISYKRKAVSEAVSSEVMQAAVAAGCPHMMKAMAAKQALEEVPV